MKKLIGSGNRILAGIITLFVFLAISYGCTKQQDNLYSTGGNPGGTGSKGGPGTNEVWIVDMAFNPSSITVVAGTTITWTNKDAATHNVTSNTAGQFGSPSLGINGIFSYTFNTAGTFQYKCTFHPSMTGTVIVN